MTASYLLRTENDLHYDYASKLLLFTDEGDGFTTTNEQRLALYLRHLILLNHYSGLGPLIKTFWRWNEDDSREELGLALYEEVPELEREFDQHYKVYVKDTLDEVTRFVVRIK